MLSPVVTLALLTGAGIDPYVPCPTASSTEIVDVAPGPSQSGVPRDASVWFRTRNLTADALDVRLQDAFTHANVALEIEAVLEWDGGGADAPREGAFRFRPREPLTPGRAYTLSWRDPRGEPDGHVFVVGHDVAGPAPLAPERVESSTAAFGVSCQHESAVAVSAAHAGVFLLATVDGEARGFARGLEVEAFVRGQAGARVIGEVVSLDLAGQRSAMASPFEAVVPRVQTPPPFRVDEGGCTTTGAAAGELTLALVLVAAMARRRRAREPRA